MKKTLIALTLATLPVAAMAEVVLYGNIRAGYELNSTKVTNVDRSPYKNGIADYGSYIGFKGSEDLGNGLKAIWQVESKVNLAGGGTSGNTFSTRDSFIGLEGGFGRIRAGNLSNYQNSDMAQVDVWEYSSDALGLGKFTREDKRYPGVRYDSPVFAGFSGSLMYATRDNLNGDTDSRTAVKDSTTGDYYLGRTGEAGELYNLGLSYENSGWFAKYAFQLQKHNVSYATANGKTDYKDGQIHRLEAGYDANNLFVGLGYQNSRNVSTYADTAFNYALLTAGSNVSVTGANIALRGQEAVLSVGYHFGNLFPKISYAHGWNVKDSVDGGTYQNTKYDQIVLGTDYSLSKRTTANVQVGWMREGLGKYWDTDGVYRSNGSAKTTAFGVGLKHVF